MSQRIYRKEDQVKGQFNQGAILENKPVQLTDDYTKLQPYSNLFYWAHAWSDEGSLIGEHPHQAFEIISIVLKGEIEHYDSAHKGWKKLSAGEAQIIRAGSGISHAERIGAGAEIFQIWLDPDLSKTISKPATYNDYPVAAFPVTVKDGLKVKTYVGEHAPMQIDTPGITMQEIEFKPGTYFLIMRSDFYQSIYLIEGEVEVDNSLILPNDFILGEQLQNFSWNARTMGRLFIIESPVKPGYATYASRYLKLQEQ